jgi:hypothetical protein
MHAKLTQHTMHKEFDKMQQRWPSTEKDGPYADLKIFVLSACGI